VSVTAGGRVVGRGELDRRSPRSRSNTSASISTCRWAAAAAPDLIVEAVRRLRGLPPARSMRGPIPVYYAGVDAQGGRPIDQRSLGVAFKRVFPTA
jgi:hypothetical protein